MTVEERDRRELQEALMATLGPDETDTLLGYLPPVGWKDVATRQDLDTLGAGLRGEMAELRGEMAELRSELRGEMSQLRGEMSELRGETRGGIGDLRAEMHHQFRVQFFWMVSLWIAGLGLLIALHSTAAL
jgi:hypothetical protein